MGIDVVVCLLFFEWIIFLFFDLPNPICAEKSNHFAITLLLLLFFFFIRIHSPCFFLHAFIAPNYYIFFFSGPVSCSPADLDNPASCNGTSRQVCV